MKPRLNLMPKCLSQEVRPNIVSMWMGRKSESESMETQTWTLAMGWHVSFAAVVACKEDVVQREECSLVAPISTAQPEQMDGKHDLDIRPGLIA